MRWLLCAVALMATACSSWSAQNKSAADACMRRCNAQGGSERPREEVHASQPERALVPWGTSNCEQRCSAAATGNAKPKDLERPPEPFEPDQAPDAPSTQSGANGGT